MYKQINKVDTLKYLGLEAKYKVDALVIYGTWNHRREIKIFKNVIEKYCKTNNLEFSFRNFDNFLQNILEIKIGKKTIWFAVGYGGALLSEYVHQACQLGSECNIVLGTCGGLSKEMLPGEIIFPTESFGDESITRMYQPFIKSNLHKSRTGLTNSMIQKFKDFDPVTKIYKGKMMTCQAILPQSWSDVLTWAWEGYLGVELETASIFAVSNAFDVRSAACLVIAENMIIEVEEDMHTKFKEDLELMIELKSKQYLLALKTVIEFKNQV